MNQNPFFARTRALTGRVDAALDLLPDWLVRWWQWLTGWVVGRWKRLLPVLQVLFYCRFSVGVVAVAAGLLWFTDQGKEIAIRVGDDLVQTLFAVVGAFFWAFHSWFDGRRVLRRRFGPDRGEIERGPCFKELVDRVPRLIGSAAYLIAASSALIAWYKLKFRLEDWHGLLLFLNLAFAVLFFYLMKTRKRWQPRLLGIGKASVLDLAPWVMRGTWIYGVVLFLTATLIPVRFGFWAGSLGIVFLALSTIVSVGSWLVRETTPKQDLAMRNPAQGASNFPVMSALFALAVILTFWPFNDNHRLPTLDLPVSQRPNLDQFLETWRKQAPTVQGRQPMVLVATAGGGIRAAYWTASVLGQITDAEPSFRNSLFAISGVSGGSVGAAVYTATIRERGRDCAEAAPKPGAAKTGCITDPALQSLSQEFLAPVIARMFYPDLIQRFLPIALLPDRATALSAAWQHNWAATLGEPRTAGLDAPLSSLGQADPGRTRDWLPALLLNSTHVETGQRVIASNLNLDAVKRPENPPGDTRAFQNAVDLLSLLNADVTLGTATLNSARFPYVSPPGTLPCAGSSRFSFCGNGHVVDGGYFENFGAVTAKQLLDAVPLAGTPIRPLVILISNDAGVGTSVEDDTPPTQLPSVGIANETLAPLRTVLHTRSSRGLLAAKDLRSSVPGGDYFHFRMILKEGQAEPALGWVLDVSSERLLRNMLVCTEGNRLEFDRLLTSLGVPEDRRKVAETCEEETKLAEK